MRRFSVHLPNIKQHLRTMNLFRKESSTSGLANVERMAVVATRFYLILLIASMSILLLYHTLYEKTVHIKVSNPTLETFERLQAAYSSTFSCQCREISMVYGSFSSITPTYHQVSQQTNQIELVENSSEIETIANRCLHLI